MISSVQVWCGCMQRKLDLRSSATEQSFDGRSYPVYAARPAPKAQLTPCVTTASLRPESKRTVTFTTTILLPPIFDLLKEPRAPHAEPSLPRSVLLSAAAMNNYQDSELRAKVQFRDSILPTCNSSRHCRTCIRGSSIAGSRK